MTAVLASPDYRVPTTGDLAFLGKSAFGAPDVRQEPTHAASLHSHRQANRPGGCAAPSRQRTRAAATVAQLEGKGRGRKSTAIGRAKAKS
jgi:hypothetical protein